MLVSFVLFVIFGETTEWEDVRIGRESHQPCEYSALIDCRHLGRGAAWLSPDSDAWLSEPTSHMMSTSKRRKCSGFDNLMGLDRIASIFSIEPLLDPCYQQTEKVPTFPILSITSPAIFNPGHHQSTIASAKVHTAAMLRGQALYTPLGHVDQNSQSK
jgi:hypothetical protein